MHEGKVEVADKCVMRSEEGVEKPTANKVEGSDEDDQTTQSCDETGRQGVRR